MLVPFVSTHLLTVPFHNNRIRRLCSNRSNLLQICIIIHFRTKPIVLYLRQRIHHVRHTRPKIFITLQALERQLSDCDHRLSHPCIRVEPERRIQHFVELMVLDFKDCHAREVDLLSRSCDVDSWKRGDKLH